MSAMRIAILGSGGVGGYFGGRLAAGGDEVTFIARGAHLAALREHGLRIFSPDGDAYLPRVQATDTTASVGQVDVVFFSVKLYDTESALALLPPLIGPETLVVSLQNGVDAVDVLTRAVGARHTAGGTTQLVAAIAEPGVIRHGALGRLAFGPLQSEQRPLLRELYERCHAAGIETVLSDEILFEIWSKFARLTAFSGMTSVTRCPIGPLQADPELWAMTKTAIEECVSVARAKGIALPPALVDEICDSMSTLPPQSKTSMLGDLERGRPLELPWLSGAVVRFGEETGVPTPIHRFVATVLAPHVNGAPRT
jgi:2-dehydropantoate 2-reductase